MIGAAPQTRLAGSLADPGYPRLVRRQRRSAMACQWMTVRAVWATMPLSERIGGMVFAVAFPVLILAFALVLP